MHPNGMQKDNTRSAVRVNASSSQSWDSLPSLTNHFMLSENAFSIFFYTNLKKNLKKKSI